VERDGFDRWILLAELREGGIMNSATDTLKMVLEAWAGAVVICFLIWFGVALYKSRIE
jgi:hypothetical protein